MPLDGIRNLEWLAHNAARNYPLVITADGKSTDELFELPVNVLTGVYVYLPWDRDIDPSRFFVLRILNLPDKLTIEIGYQPLTGAPIAVGSASTSRSTFSPTQVLPLVPANGWDDVVGTVLIDELPEGNKAPIGVYSFEYEQTQLEVDCIRPAARSLSGIVVTDRAEQSILATGIVNIVAGGNMRARVEVDGNEYTIYLDAVDGSEFGSDCACGVELGDPIYFINDVRPDEQGNIDLVGAKCLDITVADNSINLINPCSEPCCGCETAEQLTDAIRPLVDDLDLLKSAADRLGNEQLSLKGIIDSIGRYNPSIVVTPTTTPSPTTTTSTTTTTTTTTSTTTTTTEAPAFAPPTAECWVHFDGVFVSPPNDLESPDPFGDWGQFIRGIYTGDIAPAYSEFTNANIPTTNVLGPGFGLVDTAAPDASIYTLDSLVVPPGVRIEFFATETSETPLINILGPKVVYAYNRRPTTYFHHAQVTALLTSTWEGTSPTGVPWQTVFPPSSRVWSDVYSSVLMRDWRDYYCRITCVETPTTTTSTSTTTTSTSTSTTTSTTTTTPSPTDDPIVLCNWIEQHVAEAPELGPVFDTLCDDVDVTFVPPSTSAWVQISKRMIIDTGEVDNVSAEYPDAIVELGTERAAAGFGGVDTGVILGVGSEGFGVCLLGSQITDYYGDDIPLPGGGGTEAGVNNPWSFAVSPGAKLKLWSDATKTLLIAEITGPAIYYEPASYTLLTVDGHLARTWTGLLPNGSSMETVFPPSTRRAMQTDLDNYFGDGFFPTVLNCMYLEVVAA